MDALLEEAGVKAPYKDGNAWCVLFGNDIQEGICGFGSSKAEAFVCALKELLKGVSVPKKFKHNNKCYDTKQWCISHFKECIRVTDNEDYKKFLSESVITWLENINESCGGEVNDEAMQEQLQIWLEKGKTQGRHEVIFNPEKYGLQRIEPKFQMGDVMRTKDEAASGVKDGLPVVIAVKDGDYICNNERIPVKNQKDYEYPPMNRRAIAPDELPHWKKNTLPNNDGTGYNSDFFIYKGYHINFKELFNKLPKDE